MTKHDKSNRKYDIYNRIERPPHLVLKGDLLGLAAIVVHLAAGGGGCFFHGGGATVGGVPPATPRSSSPPLPRPPRRTPPPPPANHHARLQQHTPPQHARAHPPAGWSAARRGRRTHAARARLPPQHTTAPAPADVAAAAGRGDVRARVVHAPRGRKIHTITAHATHTITNTHTHTPRTRRVNEGPGPHPGTHCSRRPPHDHKHTQNKHAPHPQDVALAIRCGDVLAHVVHAPRGRRAVAGPHEKGGQRLIP